MSKRLYIIILACTIPVIPVFLNFHRELTEEKEVLSTVQILFDAMADKDIARTESVLYQDGRTFSVRDSCGTAILRTIPHKKYSIDLAAEQADLKEQMEGPKVLVDGRLAVVWTPYSFYVNGELSHTGTDVFNLIKTDSGWKIMCSIYSIEK